MKVWNSFSTEKVKCIFCNRVTYDYKIYEIEGLSIKVGWHSECDRDVRTIMKHKLTEIKKAIKNG